MRTLSSHLPCGAFVLVLAGAAVQADAEEAPPVHVQVEMEGAGWSGENCEGGEWTLGWSGPVAVEPGPLADLLISYTAFDTTQPNQGDVPPARFAAKPVTCRDNRGNVVLRANGASSASNQVRMSVSLADDASTGSPAIAFSADELSTCSVSGPAISMEMPVMVGVDTRATNTLSPALQITLEDLKNGFDKSYRFDGTVVGVAEQLEMLEPQLDDAVKEYVRIGTRLQYCERASSATHQPGPQPPKPGEKPPVEIPVEEPTEIPVPDEPTPPTPEEPRPPPVQEPGQKVYGLACRIQDLRAPGVAQRLQALRQYVLAERTSAAPGTTTSPTPLESFTNVTIDTAPARAAELRTLHGLAQGLRTLQRIAAAHVEQLAQARSELQQWQSGIDRMQSALAAGDEQSRAAFAEFRAARDRLVLGAAERGLSSIETMMETDECRDRLEVEIDQVRARYD